ncbi:MAG: FtsX-like permease family protein [bacterium]|nr:FtsX-like permease family protein [bacterium]
MLELKLAYRNLVSAGLRTWLNVVVLSITYVLIIWHQGFFSGILRQSEHDMIKDEVGGGQYWYKSYDPYDPISLDESHGIISPKLQSMINKNEATPILIRQASIYPNGRAQSILLKGIDPSQKILSIPSGKLKTDGEALPILVGRRMAINNSLKIGDFLTIRLRDSKDAFDAVEGQIVEIMNTRVSTIDNGQLWIPLKKMQEIVEMNGEATLVVLGQNVTGLSDSPDWKFREQKLLLKDIIDVIKSKRIASVILYIILLFLAMLAIFDTQVLSVFRRRKEIGTLIALGMTRLRVVRLFTFEGAMNGVLAALVGAVYGIPILVLTAINGIPMPDVVDSLGFALSGNLYPLYSAGLVIGTIIIVMITVTIVSYLPSSKIANLKPTEALKGKIG